MAFSIKNFNGITAQLILYVSSHTTSLTDFNIGSKIRTILEAFAEELEYFYLEMFRGILEGINSGVYNSFDFQTLGAVSASGLVTFSLVQTGTTNAITPISNITIPAGLIVQVPTTTLSLVAGSAVAGTSYAVNQDTVWAAGSSSINVAVTCTQAGSVGNTIANSINTISGTLPTVANGTYQVINPASFINGADSETDAARRQRFSEYLQSLARGTVDAIQYAAKQSVLLDANGNVQEQVKKVVVVEPYVLDGSKPTAYVDIYIYNGTGQTSQALVTNTQNIIDGYYDTNGNRVPGYKSAGIIATVLPVVESPVNFSIDVQMNSGYSLTTAIQSSISNAISTYVSSLNPGDSLLLNRIIELVISNNSIYNCSIVYPAGDVIVPNYTTIVTISGMTINQVNTIDITSETGTVN